MPAARLAVLTTALLLVLSAPASAIVGGTTATERFPWMVELEFRSATSSTYDFNCGASLVKPDVVLTAAHCVDAGDGEEGRPDAFPADQFRFGIGSNKRSAMPERIVGAQVLEHPDYDVDGGVSDVALVKLSSTATKGAPIALVQDADRDRAEPGDPSTVIGWGSDAFLVGDVSDDLMQVDVPIQEDTKCTALTANPFLDPERQICAGEDTGGADSCQGDSGGPLMVKDAAGAWKQLGVVSFGNGCGYPTQYGVYAEVGQQALRDWVQTNAAALSTADDVPATTTNQTPSSNATSTTAPSTTAASTSTPSSAPPVVTLPSTSATKARLKLPAALGSLRRAKRRRAFVLGLRFTAPVTVSATLRRGGRLLARGTRRGLQRGTLRMRLTAAGRRAKVRRAVLRVVVVDAQGRRHAASRTVRITR